MNKLKEGWLKRQLHKASCEVYFKDLIHLVMLKVPDEIFDIGKNEALIYAKNLLIKELSND